MILPNISFTTSLIPNDVYKRAIMCTSSEAHITANSYSLDASG
nr:MAG TPA: hypothetical protein [Caudoviricetes sp.]